MMPNNQSDVAVVGGGICGLAAAALLARAGKRVSVFEQSKSIGGRARTKIRDGFHFNIGAHALYRSGPAASVLAELGVPYKGTPPAVSGQFAIKGGARYTFPTGPVSLLTTGLLDLPSKLEFARLLRSLERINSDAIMDVPLQEWVDSTVSHRSVRDVLLAVFRLTTYANAPDRLSAGVAIKQLQAGLTSGVLYLDRGWQTLVDGLQEAALKAGASIVTGARVDSLEFGLSGAVKGIRLGNGDHHEAPVVLIASTPAHAATLAGASHPGLRAWNDESIPVTAACMDVALAGIPQPRSVFGLGIDKPLYFSVHSAAAQLAPEGGALIHLIRYLAPGNRESADLIRNEFEELLDLMQPGWRELLVHSEFLPELVVANRLPEARTGGNLGWPGCTVPEIPGLFLAGDWVGRGGCLADASLASARRAAESIAGGGATALAAAV
jgi:phytoene dehydrogenase-like protein